MAELVDARDLGSRGPWPWGFESPLSHSPRRATDWSPEQGTKEESMPTKMRPWGCTSTGPRIRSRVTRNSALITSSTAF